MGSLRAISLIKEKMYGKLKGRTCADGSPKICYIPKQDVSTPTIYLEYLFTSIIIDAHEERYVDIFDVPRAYLNADMPKENS